MTLKDQLAKLVPFGNTENMPEPKEYQSKDGVKVVKISGTGIENFSGYINEDYLDKFKYPRDFAKIYDKMRRQDAVIAKTVKIVTDFLVSAVWEFRAKEGVSWKESESDIEIQKEFYTKVFINGMEKSWTDKLREICSAFVYGFSIFEETFDFVCNDPDIGSHIGIKDWGWRSPKRVERWIIDRDENLAGVAFYGYGDANKTVTIPAEAITHFSFNSEGQDFNGRSLLRPIYGNYKRRQLYYNKLAIAMGKFGIPVPVAEIPSGELDTEEAEATINSLRNYAGGRESFLIRPEGWKIELQDVKYDPQKAIQAIKHENFEIMSSILANFIELGQGGGSYALAKDLSDIFLLSVTNYAVGIEDKINRGVIAKLHKYNFGDAPLLVELKASGISDKFGESASTIFKNLSESGLLRPDDPLEENLRKKLGLPPIDFDTLRVSSSQEGEGGSPSESIPDENGENKTEGEFSEPREYADARPIKKKMDECQKKIVDAMNERLPVVIEKIQKHMIASLEKSGDTGSIPIPDISTDKVLVESIKESLVKLSDESIDFYEADYRKRSTKKLAETSRKGKTKLDRFVKLAVFTSITDIKGVMGAVWLRTITGSTETAIVAIALKGAMDRWMKANHVSAKAANLTTTTVSNAEKDFSDGIKNDKLISYTYINPNPKSAICKKIRNKTVASDSADAKQFIPPLHHMCKTIRVGNYESMSNNPKPVKRFNLNKTEIDSANLVW